MKLDHIAIWTKDLERLKNFYLKYFEGKSNEKYVNPKKQFESYFISFESGSRVEIMTRQDIPDSLDDAIKEFLGYIHISISVGSKENVDRLTEQLRADGYSIIGYPRITGDGCYESVILDPDGNRVEIVG